MTSHPRRSGASSFTKLITQWSRVLVARCRPLVLFLKPRTPRGPHLENFMALKAYSFARVSTRPLFDLAFVAVVLSLAACGGGGGTDTTTAPVAVVAPATPAPAAVTIQSVFASNGETGVSVMVANATIISSGTATVGGVPAVVSTAGAVVDSAGKAVVLPPSAVSVIVTVPTSGGTLQAVKTVSGTCPTLLPNLVGGVCKVPEWITPNMVIRSSTPVGVAKRQIVTFDGVTSKAYSMPTGTHSCAIGVKLGPHGGFLVTCVSVGVVAGVDYTSVAGTYELAPLASGWYSAKLDSNVRFAEPDYLSGQSAQWWLTTALCSGGAGRQVPSSVACMTTEGFVDIMTIAGSSDRMGGFQSAVAAEALIY